MFFRIAMVLALGTALFSGRQEQISFIKLNFMIY